MSEPAYNLFLFVEHGVIVALGAAVHSLDGPEDAALKFLQSRVNLDCHAARRYPLDPPIPWGRYQAMMHMGSHLSLLEPMFVALGAPEDPLMLITPIVDGFPQVTAVTDLGPLNLAELNRVGPEPRAMDDYLVKYTTGGAFDMPRLLDDDYFVAIKLLFNAHKYVSGSKLLMSFIDTMAFVEYGDVQGSFGRWLTAFADMNRLGISAEQLWEYRNSLLHMSNLSSRKVAAGKVEGLTPYFGPEVPRLDGSFLNLWTLVGVLSEAVGRWIATYNATPEKMLTFIERYDLVISDARLSTVILDTPSDQGGARSPSS